MRLRGCVRDFTARSAVDFVQKSCLVWNIPKLYKDQNPHVKSFVTEVMFGVKPSPRAIQRQKKLPEGGAPNMAAISSEGEAAPDADPRSHFPDSTGQRQIRRGGRRMPDAFG